jgi:hypothetical protein
MIARGGVMTRSVALLILAALIAVAAAAAAGDRSSPLDGTWKWAWTRAELLRNGGQPRDASAAAGTHTATFANGHSTARNLRTGEVSRARFSVHGNVVGFVFSTRGPGYVPGRTYELRWSIYRDRLTFSELPSRSVLTWLPITPWTRVA